jgi:copper chaperone
VAPIESQRQIDISTREVDSMTTSTYAVTGMTCEHCVHAVTTELTALPDVTDVAVDLAAGDVSTVTVTSTRPLDAGDVAAAIDEAGYELVPAS